MNPAFARSWSFDPWVVGPLLLTAWIFIRGWLSLRQRGSMRFGRQQLISFLAGLSTIFLALASPIEAYSSFLLHIHMVQHLLLMMAAPPLLWLGDPLLPLLRGLPAPVRRYWISPLFRSRLTRTVFRRLTSLPVAWALFVAATWIWHVPQFYQLALESSAWHYVQHAFFLVTAMVFWYAVVQPYPARASGNRWAILPYLFLADIQNTALSALLTFSDRPLYPWYSAMPRLWGLSAVEDQNIAGVIMWVPGSLAFLLPLGWIGCRLLFGSSSEPDAPARVSAVRSLARPSQKIPLPLVTDPPARDVLRWPVVGKFLRWRHARLALQIPLFLLAGLIVLDGLTGPQISPMNLAGVLPWVHWRGCIVIGLLAAGNFFCMACPFMLPRQLARRWRSPSFTWPRWLRSKWLAVGLLLTFFWAYEVFALWSSPCWTAWIVLGYFVAAFLIDVLFRGAAFCKYLCPVGQFQFVQARVATLEIKALDTKICARCQTKNCIRGTDGCELSLFLPRKSGNMDCTFCLDCVHACPHDNVGMVAGIPGRELLSDPPRSGLGRLSRRLDVGVMTWLLVFAAFVNAAGMVSPILDWQDRLADVVGDVLVVKTLFVLFSLILLPLILVSLVNAASRWWSGETGPWVESATRFGYAMIPLGFGMWLTHYSFHLFTSAGAIIPVTQRLALDWGGPWLGLPDWACSCCVMVGSWLLRLEIIFLDLGLVASLYVGYRVATSRHALPLRSCKAFAPWAMLMLLLFAVGIWIVFQPMEMRGAMEAAR